MYDFVAENGVLKEYNGTSTRITIPAGITEIGFDAFRCRSNLRSVIMGKDVVKINRDAFSCCSDLTSVTMTNVVEIDDFAFHDCRKLETVDFGSRVETIGTCAFYGCNYLQKMVLPSSLKKIGHDAFYGCVKLTKLVIPDSVGRIERNAFYGCSSLTDLKIGEGVKHVGKGAFNTGSRLRYNVYGGLKYLGNDANPYVVLVHANKAEYPVCVIHKDVKAIVERTFEKVRISELRLFEGMTTVSDLAFFGVKKLETLVVPSTVTEIGRSAFSNCDDLKTVVIKGGVRSVGNMTFYRCGALTTATLENGVTALTYGAFENSRSLTTVDAKNRGALAFETTEIGAAAFYFCSSLKNVVIPDTVETIGKDAFMGAPNLQSINVRADMRVFSSSFGRSKRPIAYFPFISDQKEKFKAAFEWLNGNRRDTDLKDNILEYVVRNRRQMLPAIAQGGNGLAIGTFFDAIESSKLAIDLIDDALTRSNEETRAAILDYKNKKFTPEDIEKFETEKIEKIFGLREYTLEDWKLIYTLTSGKGGYVIKKYKGVGESIVTIPAEINGLKVVEIGAEAFLRCKDVLSVEIGANIDEIGQEAFRNCKALQTAIISDGVTCIGGMAFIECHELTRVQIGKNVAIIGSGAFARCEKIEEIVIPDSVEAIGEMAFRDDLSLKTVVIGKGVRKIYMDAFRDCVALNKVEFKDKLDRVGSYAFAGCASLKSVTLADGTVTVGSFAFSGCVSLSFVSLPKSVSSIEECAFKNCDKLKSIEYRGKKEEWRSIKKRRFPSIPIHCLDGILEE